MIKVNLAGAGGRRTAKRSGRTAGGEARAVPILQLLIVIGTLAGGGFWYSSLAAQNADLRSAIDQAKRQEGALESRIRQNQVDEARHKVLARRVEAIRALQRERINPIVLLDALSDAIESTDYVWLSSLDQNNAALNVSGAATSLEAIADFETNLRASGYFRNIELVRVNGDQGNFSFALNCLFAPMPAEPAAGRQSAGSN
jgi:Tfp pilus assembly protein PilN